jgi:hypothetical protein
MGSPAAQAVSAYDGLVWFQSDGEMTREVGCSRQRRGLENSAGARLSPMNGVGRVEQRCGGGSGLLSVLQVWVVHGSACEQRDTTGGRPEV